MNFYGKIAIAAFAVSGLFQCSRIASAEGSDKRTGGNWGVNRRVMTPPNYREVSGHFSMSFGQSQKIISKNGRKIAAYTQETLQDRPSPYLGGGIGTAYEVDTGLQFNGLLPDTNSDESTATDPEPGWFLFMRSTNADTKLDNTSGYCNVRYWGVDPDLGGSAQSLPWRDRHSRNIDAYLGYRVFGGEDREKVGWLGLTTDVLPVPGGGNRTMYWRRIPNYQLIDAVKAGNTSFKVDSAKPFAINDTVLINGEPPATVTAVALEPNGSGTISLAFSLPITGFISGHGKKTAVQIAKFSTDFTQKVYLTDTSPAGTSTFKVRPNDAQNLELDYEVDFGSEKFFIIGQSGNEFTIRGLFSKQHSKGTAAQQTLDCAKAYPKHPVAPWRGTPTMDTARLKELRVKRVIAMTRHNWTETQGIKDQLDGSWLTSLFTDGNVRQGPLDPGGTPHDGPWESAQVLQTPLPHEDPKKVTGYDTKNNDASSDAAWDQRFNNETQRMRQSKTIVEFPNLQIPGKDQAQANMEGRSATPASESATEKLVSKSAAATPSSVSRYTQEHVNINLRTVARLMGESISIPRN